MVPPIAGGSSRWLRAGAGPRRATPLSRRFGDARTCWRSPASASSKPTSRMRRSSSRSLRCRELAATCPVWFSPRWRRSASPERSRSRSGSACGADCLCAYPAACLRRRQRSAHRRSARRGGQPRRPNQSGRALCPQPRRDDRDGVPALGLGDVVGDDRVELRLEGELAVDEVAAAAADGGDVRDADASVDALAAQDGLAASRRDSAQARPGNWSLARPRPLRPRRRGAVALELVGHGRGRLRRGRRHVGPHCAARGCGPRRCPVGGA